MKCNFFSFFPVTAHGEKKNYANHCRAVIFYQGRLSLVALLREKVDLLYQYLYLKCQVSLCVTFVCNSPVISLFLKNYFTKLHEIFRDDLSTSKNQSIRFGER